ncbi:MAG: hypothetical protein A2340_11155 [Lentisphaerae bacterium RIFOXYB12_FULL_60_10]|nr:MAG: hypothetical protein A2340_11155 [Lentisphaerae bacterium RIFOXYB12_FULL_60_10]
MHRKRGILVLLVVVVLAVWGIRRLSPRTVRRDLSYPLPARSGSPAVTVPVFQRLPVSGDAVVPVRDVTTAHTPVRRISKPDPGVIPGEYVLSFYDEADQQRFIRQVQSAGGVVVDRMPFAHAVRIRLEPGLSLDDVLAGGPVPVDQSPNLMVRVPSSPDPVPGLPAMDHSYTGFGDQVLDWLGVPQDNSRWGAGITVAVLDGGVGDSPALAGDRLKRLDLLNGTVAADGQSSLHATAVASLLAGLPGDGVTGVAPACNVLSVRVLDADGSGNAFTVAKGIVAAVDAGARILNLSLGGYGDAYIMRQAIQYATERGVIVVAAAGNDGLGELAYPARYEQVVAVGAVDAAGQRLLVSNGGAGIDVMAPGVGIQAAGEGTNRVSFSGTSAAVPLVSGALAALLSQDAAGPADVARLLRQYADDAGLPGIDEEYGHGVLNIQRVLERSEPGIHDVAVGTPLVKETGGVPYLTLVIQNRGTEMLDKIELDLDIDGVASVHGIYRVPVGVSVAREFRLDGRRLVQPEGVHVRYAARLPDVIDVRPLNNAPRSVTLRQETR